MRDHRADAALQLFNAIADSYDSTALAQRHEYNSAVDQIVLKSLDQVRRNSLEPMRILDAACGTGRRWADIGSGLDAGIESIGLDFSHPMARHATDLGSHTCVVRADLRYLPLSDNSVNVVLALYFPLSYVAPRLERIRALSQCARVLKSDGVLVLDVYNVFHRGEQIDYRRSIQQVLSDLLPRRDGIRKESGDLLYEVHALNGRIVPAFRHSYRPGELKSDLRQAGFRRTEIVYLGYDTGRQHVNPTRGQLVAIARK